MPLKLHVGISRKVGLPEFSSAGASCHLEIELESGLLQHDPEAFQRQVREAYAACHQAVQEELGRLQSPDVSLVSERRRSPEAVLEGQPPCALHSTPHSEEDCARAGRPATHHQVNAIRAIAQSRQADLEGLLRQQYLVDRLEDLTLLQASALIGSLRNRGRA